ncbi:MAG: glycosyltransferase family 39 protein [Patescibacteria group bacterium]|nr:glycosyltransferase family 39 protein [Patescibacteria group bacterium]
MKSFRLLIFTGLLIVFSLGLFLRLFRLDRYPAGFTPDEAAQGYTAYSILKTGKDEWGKSFPLNLRSFGDFKPPLQTYLTIPSVFLLGLNELAVRLPNALIGSLAILTVFFFAKELFGDFLLALTASFLVSFSPWHLTLSRGAFEANLTVFFISLGGYFLLRSFDRKGKKDQFLSALLLGLNLFSYHSAKVFTPLVVLALFVYHFGFSLSSMRRGLKRMPVFLVVFSFFLLLAFSSFFLGGQKRGLDIAVFNPTDQWQVVKDSRWWAQEKMALPGFLPRVFNNKLFYSVNKIAVNYLSYLSPQFLFSDGPTEGAYGMLPGRGVLWWWELPLILFGLYRLCRKKSKTAFLILLITLAAPLPASLTKGIRSAGRAAVMMPWIQIFSAWVLVELFSSFSSLKLKKRSLKIGPKLKFTAFILVFTGFFLFFMENYFIQSPRERAKEMLYGRCQALRWVRDNYPQADKIIVSRKLSEPQAYVMFCLNYPIRAAQEQVPDWLEYQQKGLGFVDQLGEYSLGKFVFKEINWASDSKVAGSVLIGTEKEFPLVDFSPTKRIDYPDGQPAVFIYSNLSG